MAGDQTKAPVQGPLQAGHRPGCPERLTWELLKWIWDYPRNRRPRTLEFLDQYAEGRWIVRLGDAQEIDGFIAGVKGAK